MRKRNRTTEIGCFYFAFVHKIIKRSKSQHTKINQQQSIKMKSISILVASLPMLPYSISAAEPDDDTRTSLQKEPYNPDFLEPSVATRGLQGISSKSQCIEVSHQRACFMPVIAFDEIVFLIIHIASFSPYQIAPYNKQVSDWETSRVFGSPLSEEVNGPIAALFCKGGRDCPKIMLQSFAPDLPGVAADQRITTSNGRWLPGLSYGSKACNADEIVTGLQCKGSNCSRIQMKCSPLNSKLYQRSFGTTLSRESTSGFKRRTRCGKNKYMVGMECSGYGCSEIQLVCAAVEVKFPKSGPSCEGIPEPPTTCTDKRMDDGFPWSDSSDYDCNYYSQYQNQCASYGHMYRNVYTANEACCACGGGDRR